MTNATLLANLAPVFVIGTGWLLIGASVKPAFLIGLVLALVGVVLLKGGVSGLLDGDQRGDAVAVLAALFYAGYMLCLSRLRQRFDTLRIMVWRSASVALCLLPVMLLTEDAVMLATAEGWAILVGPALICHAGGQFAISYSLAFLPASFSSLTLLIQPVVAALLGVIILGEVIGLGQIAGDAIVLAGIFYARQVPECERRSSI